MEFFEIIGRITLSALLMIIFANIVGEYDEKFQEIAATIVFWLILFGIPGIIIFVL